jgi:hypothetical protein
VDVEPPLGDERGETRQLARPVGEPQLEPAGGLADAGEVEERVEQVDAGDDADQRLDRKSVV